MLRKFERTNAPDERKRARESLLPVLRDPRQLLAMIHTYGPHPDQYAELLHAKGEPLGVAVVIHGGFWRAAYDASLGREMASDLADRGWSSYNIEYRRVGGGGGWPTTLQDVADAIDLLSDLDLNLSRVVAIGHSAGGHLAAWAAGRAALPAAAPGCSPRVALTGVVAQAGVLDLRTGAETGVGGTAIPDLLGGMPGQVPERYAWADPIAAVPLPVPVVCVHSRSDDSVPFAQSEAYVAAARRAGGAAELLEFDGDHMAHIDPGSTAWDSVVGSLTRFTHP
jgi:acetyl esterase/lipase